MIDYRQLDTPTDLALLAPPRLFLAKEVTFVKVLCINFLLLPSHFGTPSLQVASSNLINIERSIAIHFVEVGG